MKTMADAVYGCIIGGAIGDALGAPIEGMNYWEIREKHGKLQEFIPRTRPGANGLAGGITDDTALRQYVALTIIRKGGRILPDDLAEFWLEKETAISSGSMSVSYMINCAVVLAHGTRAVVP